MNPDPFNSLPRQWLLTRADDAGAVQNNGVLGEIFEAGGWRFSGTPGLTACTGTSDDRTLVLTGAAVDSDQPDLGMDALADSLAGLDTKRLLHRMPRIAGNYVIFVFKDGLVTTFTDPSAACAVYMDRECQRLASSPKLLGRSTIREDLADWFGVKPHNNWIPGSLTLLEGVEALPANHTLELPGWKISRFWPTGDDIEIARAETDPGTAIASEMRRIMRFVVSDPRTAYLSLTGGRDSRVNFAAAREVTGSVRCFTLRMNGTKSEDAEIAERLAGHAGVPIEIVDCPAVTKDILDAYDRQCGGQALGGGRSVIAGCAKLVEGSALHVNGGLGVLLKNYYGSRRGARSMPVVMSELLTDFESPPALIRRGVERWFETVATLPAQVQRTLMYLEQRASRWMGPIDLGSSIFYDPFSPFASRRIVLLAAFAPDRMLEAGRLHEAVIRELWPELLAEPFTRGRGKLIRLVPRNVKERLRPLKAFFPKQRAGQPRGE